LYFLGTFSVKIDGPVSKNHLMRLPGGRAGIPRCKACGYDRNLRALVVTLAEWTEPALLELTPEADAAVLGLEAEIEPQLAPGAGLGHITDWASKLTGATARIAGLLHLAEHLRDGWGWAIEPGTIHAAARLCRYYLA
jgi:hypothetical protein